MPFRLTAPALACALLCALGTPLARAQQAADAPEDPAQPKAASTLPVVTVNSSEDSGSISSVPLQEAASTASRLDVPIKHIPASVEVVNHKAIQARGDRTVLEVTEKTAGMAARHTPGSPGAFSVRGFTSGVNWLYNGIPVPGGSGMSSRLLDAGNLERVEVLRGPSSVLHGAWGTGAAVNMITREVSFERQPIEADYSLGTHRAHRLHLGTGGVFKPGVLAWRLDYAGAHGHTDSDAERVTKHQLNASLLAKFSPTLSLTLELDHSYDDADNVYFGTPLINNRLAGQLRHINYNNLDDNIFMARNTWLRANLQWQIGQGWQLNNRLYWLKGFSDWRNVENYAWLGGTPAQVRRSSWTNLDHHRDLIGNRLDLLHTGELAGRKNRFLVGLDIHKMDFASWRNDFGGSQTVDAWHPPADSFSRIGVAKTPARESDIRQASIYAEDQFDLTEQLKLVGGLRYEQLKADWIWLDRAGHPQASKTHNYTSWRAGVVYEPMPDTSLYASVATAAEPGNTLLLINPQQSQLRLTTARQFEAGVKQSFWQGKGEWTAAIYEIRKRNVFVPDPMRPSERIAVGRQSSRGIELTAAIRPSPRWWLQANAAWVRARYDDYQSGNPPVSLAGNRPPMVPVSTFNLGAGFNPTPAWRLSAWLHHVGKVYVNDANTFTLPAYTTLDLAASWQVNPQTALTFRVRNATDKLYAQAVYYSGTQAILAPRRNFEVGVQWRF